MVNGIFRIAPRWEKLAGQTWSTRPFCRLPYSPAKHLNDSNRWIFRVGTAFALIDPNRFGLGELHAVRLRSQRRLGERRSGPEQKGSTTDGEYASRRIVTADGSGAAARCHLQQHRQREHQRLQGRQVAVRGI